MLGLSNFVWATAQPLFAAASAFESAERFEETKTILQEIGHDFREDERTWAKAMLNLAGLFDRSLHDPSAAEYILQQIQQKIPGAQQCWMAGAHLQEMQE